MSSAALEARDLLKYYARGDRVTRALDGISLRIESGEYVAVVGRSGSGKTTLVDCLGLLLQPTAGEVLVEGIEGSSGSDARRTRLRRERLGFVFQDYNLLPGLTALENVLVPARYDRWPSIRDAAAMRALRLLERVGLGHRFAFRPEELSGGEQQRVAVARALLLRPAVVLADEPTAALDHGTAAQVLDLFRELNREDRVTLLVVTHDPEVAKAADRRIEIQNGRLGPPDEPGLGPASGVKPGRGSGSGRPPAP